MLDYFDCMNRIARSGNVFTMFSNNRPLDRRPRRTLLTAVMHVSGEPTRYMPPARTNTHAPQSNARTRASYRWHGYGEWASVPANGAQRCRSRAPATQGPHCRPSRAAARLVGLARLGWRHGCRQTGHIRRCAVREYGARACACVCSIVRACVGCFACCACCLSCRRLRRTTDDERRTPPLSGVPASQRVS